ncbi:metal ABC transporter permease [Stetteria hydrogenophila]
MRTRELTLLLVAAGVAGYIAEARVNPLWAAALVAAGVGFGFLSPIVAARRMGFLSAAAAHSALLAAAIAFILLGSLQSAAPAATVIGVLLIYLAGYLVYKGYDVEVVTYLFVGFTAAASVIALYYASTMSSGYKLSSLILGDPLLATRGEAYYSLAIAGFVALVSLASYEAQVYIGVDREDARLTMGRLWLYDLAFFTMLGVASVGLIRISGFILEHVLILVPAAIAASAASSMSEALALSVASAIAASGLGGVLAIILDISPSGAIGLTLIVIYALIVLAKKTRVVGIKR